MVVALAASTAVAQQSPAPNTHIKNKASGYFTIPGNTDTVRVSSNELTTIVNKKESVVIGPDHNVVERRGQLRTFTHTLSNTGNTASTITVTVSNGNNDDFDFANLSIKPQSTNQPQPKAASSAAPQTPVSSSTVTINPSDTVSFKVSTIVNNSAKAGDMGKIIIQAQTQQNQVLSQTTNTIQVLQGPTISIQKQAIQQNPEPGKILTYRITGGNNGDQVAKKLLISVDGNSQNKVVVRDQIPANSTFQQIVDADGGQPLYHLIGEPEFTYTTQRPTDLSKVDEFAIAFDALQPGEQLDIQFDVSVNDNAAGVLENTAQLNYNDPINSNNKNNSAQTNTVQTSLPQKQAKLNYYIDNSYSDTSYATQLGDNLHLQASAAGCNANFATQDTSEITLTSKKTTDTETFDAIETSNNSGYFRIIPNVPTRDASNNPVNQDNGIFETLSNDVITATMPQCNNQKSTTANIVVDPHGVVFNSQTGEPVSGAEVTLIDVTGNGNGGNPGAPADVFNKTGNNEINSTQTTSENGQFRFPYVKSSTYRIEISPPAGYQFPSQLSASELPSDKTVREETSFGKEFVFSQPGAITFDTPLDPSTDGTLFIEKTASTENAEIGDFVNYEITVANNASSVVRDVRVEDMLPFGFRYEKGTTLRDGSPIADPDGDQGPSLTFNIGDIPANGSVTLSYRALLGTGAMKGDGKNTAVAVSDRSIQIQSNQAQHTIDVRGGVFTDKGYIIGKVFADCNENGVQDPGELGVPGVRLYLENGSFVVTDSNGQYTFYGINPNKHILKLDNYSLPEGSKLGVLDNRHAGDPSSRFVDLKKGQMHRADFSVCDCDEQTHKRIKQRQKKYSSSANSEIGSSVSKKIRVEDNRNRSNRKRAKASGVVGNTKTPELKNSDESTTPKTNIKSDTTAADSTVKKQLTLEEAMIQEEAELGFIGLQNGDTLRTAQRRIWVKSKMGASLSLAVNGDTLRNDRISKKSSLSQTNLQAQEYIGVKLSPGKNTLTLTETDPFGNPRGKKEITLFAPGKVKQIDLDVPVNDVSADGTSAAIVQVQLLDKTGIPVSSRVPVTLDVSAGQWKVKDRNPTEPGTQTYIENGSQRLKLQSPTAPQDVKVRVAIGALEETTTVSFLPDLRPLIAAGIIEGSIRLNDGASIVPAHSADGFERELKSLSYKTGNATADARAAFFLKGKIKGNMLLTAAFDSEKDDDELFRDIQPDEFYPVYGESSVKGYDAQSTSRLYVRVERKKTYALYGDFETQKRDPAKSLGEYNRTQTGLKVHYEKDWGKINVFGSQASSLQRIEEFRGRGISGPYELQSDNILVNSERVELITRDRNQPSVVIDRKKLTRFRDYVIEPFTGNIIFNAPVRSADEELNPIYIRVTYEVQDGGKDYWIGGADGQFNITDSFTMGGSFVEDRNPENNYRLKSVNSTVEFGENTRLIGEIAESTTEQDGDGRGGRLELQHRSNKIDGRLFAGQTNEDFVNRSSQLGQARTEVGARGSIELTNSTNLKTELLYSSNDTLNTNTTGGLVNVQRQFTPDIRGELGVRYSDQNQPQGQDITNKNIRSKLTVGVPKVDGATVFGEYEQDVTEWDRRLIAMGGNYSFKNRGKIYARHEFVSSALGQYNLDGSQRRQNTVVGLDASYMQNGRVYSEYRVNDTFDGRSAQAAIGLRNRFEVREGLGITASLERIYSLSGNAGNEGTSISTAVDYTTNPLWKATARAEARFSNNANSYLNTLGYGRKISPNWTFLGKNIFNLQTSSNAGTANRIQQRLRFGFAYRQADQNRWDGLGRYELKYEQNGQYGGDFNRLVHIFSTNVNFNPNADWTHSARFSAKKVSESSAQFDSNSLTMLMSGRTMYDITRKLDGGVNASFMTDAGFGSKDYGAGFEVGYVVKRNLRLAVGFNVFGFNDRDLAASNYTRKGVYLGFSYKFDERLFRGLTPDASKRQKKLYDTCNKCNSPEQVQEVMQLPEPEVEMPGIQPIEFEAPEFKVNKHKPLTTLPKDIHFASDADTLSNASKEMLQLVANFLNKQEEFTLEIIGHTDSRASYQYNLGLSKRRAESVQEYLVSLGVNKNSVEFEGLSEWQSETSKESDMIDRAMNRRVELNFEIPNANVRFIPQLNDLQISSDTGTDIAKLDYLFNTEITAVPDRIHFKDDTLSAASKYLLQRIHLALSYYPETSVTFMMNNNQTEQHKQQLKSFLQQAGTDMNRVDIQLDTGGTNRQSEEMVVVKYSGESRLSPISQDHNIGLEQDQSVKPILSKLFKLLSKREDHLLISSSNQ
ncbi:conserved repeat domain-containing protein [Fodinibius salinus]|uniref:Conserved repeat domain-containing protein n=2 Tax=Fodinibius salinus TaxID=860790 RepID=A0A5D3YNU9_9BACT|nr:conserved repeat domain-containing protein [Fodinibius salinus]